MKIRLAILVLFIGSSISFAQQNFFETIKKNGVDAIYQEYYSVGKNDKGKQYIEGKRYEVTMKPVSYKDVLVGFDMVKVEDGKKLNGFNPTRDDYEELIGYPNTSHLLHTRKNTGFVAIDDYIFELTRMTDDGLSFKSIEAIFIRKGSGAVADKDAKPKKKKSKFFKKLGATALAVATNGQVGSLESAGPDHKKAMDIDLKKMVKDYLKAMKSKQNSYTLSSKDKAEIAMVKKSVKDHHADIKIKNDSIWRTPEYQRIRENNARAAGNAKTNRVTLTNNSGRTIYIATKGLGMGSDNPGTELHNGHSTSTWDCKKSAYLQTRTKNGGSISFKTTSVKVYSANSKCGGTVIIN
jgi:hypothetical protein